MSTSLTIMIGITVIHEVSISKPSYMVCIHLVQRSSFFQSSEWLFLHPLSHMPSTFLLAPHISYKPSTIICSETSLTKVLEKPLGGYWPVMWWVKYFAGPSMRPRFNQLWARGPKTCIFLLCWWVLSDWGQNMGGFPLLYILPLFLRTGPNSHGLWLMFSDF